MLIGRSWIKLRKLYDVRTSKFLGFMQSIFLTIEFLTIRNSLISFEI